MRTLRVATYNVRCGNDHDGPNGWEFRRPLTLEMLKLLDADLVGLQETLCYQFDAIAEAFPNHRTLGVGRTDGIRDGEYSAILYRPDRLALEDSGHLWFSDTPGVPGSKSWGNEVVRMATWGTFTEVDSGRRVTHFNLHLDHISQPSRERSAELLLAQIAALPDQGVIVTGDFNVGETNPVIDAMRGAGLRDSYREIHPNEAFVGTFNGFGDNFEPDKIDYIFVNDAFAVEGAGIVRDRIDARWPSDHAPVTAELVMLRE